MINEHTYKKESVHHSDENGRRSFLKICSVVLTSLIGIAYAIPLIRAFICPAMQDTVTGSSGLFDIGNTNDCEVNVPRKVPIKGIKIDAWNKFPTTAIGAGKNFAGPAPRPLAHFEMSVDHSGRLIVNKSKVVPTETELIV